MIVISVLMKNYMNLDNLLGEERTYPEYREHNKDGVCVCAECAYTRGINVKRSEIKNNIEELLKCIRLPKNKKE